MRYFLALLLVFVLGCNKPVPVDNIPVPDTKMVQKAPQAEMPFKGDGTYHNFMLPCKCGGLIVYEPDSCPCFTAQYYPDLVDALNKTYAWFKDKEVPAPKYMGKYESLTLECGCVLCVYVPDSCGCLEKKYPDLGLLLKDVYRLAVKYKEKTA